MKSLFIKIAFVFFLSLFFCSVLSAQESNWSGNSRFSVQVMGDHEVSFLGLIGNEDVEIGLSLGLDLFYRFHDNFKAGAGYEIQFNRSQESYPGDFRFHSVYGVICLPIDFDFLTLYTIARIGYGFFFGETEYTGIYGKLTGGLYYSFGGGIEFLKFKIRNRDRVLILEATYTGNQGSIEDNYYGYSADVRYSRIDISFGVGFNIPSQLKKAYLR